MTTKEIFEKNQILTLEKAKLLKGKKIACSAPEYKMNTPHVKEFIVGDIISEWDNAANELYDGKFNRQQYWYSFMDNEQIDNKKTNLLLLSADREKQYTCHTKYNNCFDEPTFTGSDADREVYYIEI